MDWEFRVWHNDHVHYSTPASATDPDDPAVSTTTLDVDDHGDNTWREVCLNARDGSTILDTGCRELRPRKTDYVVDTETRVPGIRVAYEDEGLDLVGPTTIRPIENSGQTLSVAPVQQHRSFVGWSDGVKEPSREFVAKAAGGQFTARFENTTPEPFIVARGPWPQRWRTGHIHL